MKRQTLLLERKAPLLQHESRVASTLPRSPLRDEHRTYREWITKGIWHRLTQFLQIYFRIEVEGLENIPSQGPAILISNHSGYTALDAVMIAYLIRSRLGRRPRILAHRAYFDWSVLVKLISLGMGLIRADMKNGLQVLNDGHLLLLFPEGESGNFKASTKKYQLQRFQSGFLRMAQLAKTPVIPSIVIGAEESFLNFGYLDLGRIVDRLKIPLPINWFPLPAKWKIRFLKPLELNSSHTVLALDHKSTEQTCQQIRDLLQVNINYELKKRPYVYFPHF